MITGKQEQRDYRQRLYQNYVSRHLSGNQGLSLEAFESQRVACRAYFGGLLPKDRDARIVDLGCGGGCLLYFLEKEGYKNAIGVDTSPEQVGLAISLGLKNVQQADLMDFLGKRSDEFDAITAIDVVEHFKKEEVLFLLDAVYRALKPGGVFIMRSPNADGPFGGRYRYCDFTHELAFTPVSVCQALAAAGFQNISVYPVEPVVHGLLSGGRYLIWKGIRLLLLLYLAAETGSFQSYILTQNLTAAARKAENGS